MSREDRHSIPDELRERLEQETPEEQSALERVWHLFGETDLSYDDAPSEDETWAALQSHLDKPEALGSRSNHRAERQAVRPARHRRSWPQWVAAAALLIAAAVGGVLYWQRPVTVTTVAGTYRTATLPDGSTVELNSGTTLSYARHFSTLPFLPTEQRVVRLRGEAFFDVQHSTRPFIVETFNARIEVLGTQFNVRARQDAGADETEVTLASGRVRVANPQNTDEAIVLSKAGQSSRVTKSGGTLTPPRTVNVDRVLAWRQQGFAVSDWPLSAIFSELERRYNIRIAVRDSTVLADSMTLYYPQHTAAETIVHDIAMAKGLTYRATSQGYLISAK